MGCGEVSAGALSNDIEKLAPQRALLAGLHNPQGRVIALLRLAWLAANDILAILPRELVAVVVAKLSKFVLRAKVTIADDSANWRVAGLTGAMDLRAARCCRWRSASSTSYPRWWLVTAANQPLKWAEHAVLDREAWRRLDIAAGLPQVYGATSEAFVAQMLNLDRLDAIAFDKGCYRARKSLRAHYRGQVKAHEHFDSAAFEQGRGRLRTVAGRAPLQIGGRCGARRERGIRFSRRRCARRLIRLRLQLRKEHHVADGR